MDISVWERPRRRRTRPGGASAASSKECSTALIEQSDGLAKARGLNWHRATSQAGVASVGVGEFGGPRASLSTLVIAGLWASGAAAVLAALPAIDRVASLVATIEASKTFP